MARAGSFDVKITVVLPKEIMSYYDSLAERDELTPDYVIRSVLWVYVLSHPLNQERS